MTELQRLYQAQSKPGESARTRRMAFLEAYYLGRQYDHLARSWDESVDEAGRTIPFRQRRPSTIAPLPKLIVNTFKRLLWAEGRRPRAVKQGAGNEKANADIAALIAEAKLYRVMGEATRLALINGSGVVAWKVIDGGQYRADAWDAKWCTPTFVPGAFPLLAAIEYRYPFTVEEGGRCVTKWHREVITAQKWTVYQPVEVTADEEPQWSEDAAASVEHKLGYVPAVWFTIGQRSGAWDGTGLYADDDMLGLFDDLNFTASQQARALYQNLDPQTTISGVTDIDLEGLKKGGNVWPLPVGSEAKLLESNGEYIRSADSRLSTIRKWVLDTAAVVINDPEKIAGAQSGSALELLTAPMLAEVSDLREDVGDGAFKPLLEQMYRDKSGKAAAMVLHWGAMSPSTVEDARGAAEALAKAVDAGILSKSAAARYLAPYVGVTDVEGDQAQVESEATQASSQLESAAAVADIPSPTFQALHRGQLAVKTLRESGVDVTPALEKKIMNELAANLTGEALTDEEPGTDEEEGDDATDSAAA